MSKILCILAGGQSKRFGRSKLDVLVEGMPILLWFKEHYAAVEFDAYWLSMAPSQTLPAGADAYDKIIHDEQTHQGPLNGIAAAVNAAEDGDALVMLPVDMPLVNPELLGVLFNCLNLSTEQAGVMLKWALGEKSGTTEPFPSIWRAGVANDILKKAIGQGKGGPSQIIDSPAFGKTFLHFEEDEVQFRNFNRQSDLKPLGELLGKPLTVK